MFLLRAARLVVLVPVLALAASCVPASAFAGTAAPVPSIEVIRAPARSPIDLVGTGYGWGVRTGKGDRLPAGGSLVRGRVPFLAGTPARTVARVTLACPAGQRIVELADFWALSPLRIASRPARWDRDTTLTLRVSATKTVTARRTARAAIICFETGRLRALRARQERQAVNEAARSRPEVRRAPRRLLCRDSYVQQAPGHLVIGNVAAGDPVRVLRRSASGRYTEILGLRAFNRIGWIRTRVLCG